MEGAGKLVILAVLGVASYALWSVRRAKAQRVLAEIDEGRRCISCHGNELVVSGDVATCARCGHAFSLAAMRGVKISERDVAAITKPPREDL